MPVAEAKLTRMKADTFRAMLRLGMEFRGPVHVPEMMKIRDTGIERLCGALCVDGDLDLRGCVNLRELPAKLVVRGKLILDGCALLSELPATARELFGLSAVGCTALTSISSLVDCRGPVDLSDCPSMTSLAPDFRVIGKLKLSGCVVRPNSVYLTTKLPESVLTALPGRRLREVVAPAALALHPVLDTRVASADDARSGVELELNAGALFRE